MTVIVAAKDRINGRTLLAADSAIQSGGDQWIMAEPKIFPVPVEGNRGEVAYMGLAGYFSMRGMLAEFTLRPGPFDIAWAHQVAIDINRLVSAVPGNHMSSEGAHRSEILLAVNDKIYMLDANLALEPADDYAAVGSGAGVALGVMYAHVAMDKPFASDYTDAVGQAVEAACRYSAGCDLDETGPVRFVLPHHQTKQRKK